MPKDLPETIFNEFKQLTAKGRERWQAGDISSAESNFLQAWHLIPDPKLEYDYAQSMVRGLVIFYRDTHQADKAKAWLPLLREAYGPGINLDAEFTAATVFHETGEYEDAYRIFDAQYKQYKTRPFQGEDKKYLDFYKNYGKSK